MQLFLKLFEPYLQWFYHCFDRIVINGYLSFLTRENNAAYFFREVCKKPKITKEVLTQRTRDYQAWVSITPATTNCLCSGRRKAFAKKIWFAPGSNAWPGKTALGSITSFKAWNRAGRFAQYPQNSPPKTPTFSSCASTRAATRIITSTFWTRSPARWSCAWVPSCPSRSPPISMATISLSANCAAKKFLSAKRIIVFFPLEIPRLCRKPPINSTEKHCSNESITGRSSSDQSFRPQNVWRVLACTASMPVCRSNIAATSFSSATGPLAPSSKRSCELGLYLLTADRVAVLFGQQKLRQTISGKWQNV